MPTSSRHSHSHRRHHHHRRDGEHHHRHHGEEKEENQEHDIDIQHEEMYGAESGAKETVRRGQPTQSTEQNDPIIELIT